jgi:SAM-dependent methyltransferase
MPTAGSPIAQYYNWLAWYQTLVSRLGHRGGFDPLTIHRLLTPDRPDVAPADVVHNRVLGALGALRSPRVIDAGCGVGGTSFFLQSRVGGRYDGLTLSPVQAARASREARRRGVDAECRFHVRSYDQPLDDLAGGGADAGVDLGVDLILAIESLAHAADPAHSIVNLARVLTPGGRLAIVDDVPEDALSEEDGDFRAFRAGWSCPSIARAGTLARALRSAQLNVEHEEDLTPLVPRRDEVELERLIRTNRRWRSVLGATKAGALVDSLYGGLMLERLYARGLMRYRFLLARRTTVRSVRL